MNISLSALGNLSGLGSKEDRTLAKQTKRVCWKFIFDAFKLLCVEDEGFVDLCQCCVWGWSRFRNHSRSSRFWAETTGFGVVWSWKYVCKIFHHWRVASRPLVSVSEIKVLLYFHSPNVTCKILVCLDFKTRRRWREIKRLGSVFLPVVFVDFKKTSNLSFCEF